MSYMRIFYVDYENVMDRGLNGIAKLTSDDIVKIFYSEDAQRISFGTHRRIIESKAVFVYQRLSSDMKTLKNALDFLIIHELEATMKSDKSSEYYIISKDSDFDGFIEEKLKKKYKIKRLTEVCKVSTTDINKELKPIQKNNSNISNSNIVKENIVKIKTEQEDVRKKKEQTIRSYIGRDLKEYNECREYIIEAYMESKSKQELNNKLQQTFENENVSEILMALKNFIKEMPGR